MTIAQELKPIFSSAYNKKFEDYFWDKAFVLQKNKALCVSEQLGSTINLITGLPRYVENAYVSPEEDRFRQIEKLFVDNNVTSLTTDQILKDIKASIDSNNELKDKIGRITNWLALALFAVAGTMLVLGKLNIIESNLGFILCGAFSLLAFGLAIFYIPKIPFSITGDALPPGPPKSCKDHFFKPAPALQNLEEIGEVEDYSI